VERNAKKPGAEVETEESTRLSFKPWFNKKEGHNQGGAQARKHASVVTGKNKKKKST